MRLCNKCYDRTVVTEGAEPVSRLAAERVRGVERALVRAQELVDRKPTRQGALSWYVEATQVGDLSLLALLLQRTRGTPGSGREGPRVA
jgi:hypothetical protein